MTRVHLLPALVVVALSRTASAEITNYSGDFSGWQAAAGPYETCSFTEFPQWTIITDQYADLGVLFTNPWSDAVKLSESTFTIDGVGIDANGVLELTFAEIMHAAAIHTPGIPRLKLFSGDQFLGEVFASDGPPGNFVGAFSTIGFDRVQFVPPNQIGEVFADNVYFSTIPGPGVLGVFAISALFPTSRRRR